MLGLRRPSSNPTNEDYEEVDTLVKAAQSGAPDAFASLVEKYYRLVYAITLGQLRSPEAAEELTQEVFVRVHLHLDKLREPKAFPAWVRRIARNESCRWLARRQSRSELTSFISLEELGADVLDTHASSPRQQAVDRQEIQALRTALDRLPTEQREIVLLHYIEGQSKSEVARQLGIHHATVGRQLDKITSTLRVELEPFVARGMRQVSTEPRGLARTVAACSVVAALPNAQRALLAEKFAASADFSTHLTGIGALLKSLMGAGSAKVLTSAALVIVAAVTGITISQRHSSMDVATTDAEFEKILRMPAPSDYIVRVKTSSGTNLTPTANGAQANIVGNGSARQYVNGSAVDPAALRQIVNAYTTANISGIGSDGFQALLRGMSMSATFATIRGVPIWAVEQLPANAPAIDTVFRTPKFPELSRVKIQPGQDPEHVFGPFFTTMNKTISDRFLAEVNWKMAARSIAVPVVRLVSPAAAGGNVSFATASPDIPSNAQVPNTSITWKNPVDLDTIGWAFLAENQHPALLEIDPAIKTNQPTRWPGELKLPNGDHPAELGQLLSYVYNVPYEVVWRQNEVCLIYDEKQTSEKEVTAWQAADSKATHLTQ